MKLSKRTFLITSLAMAGLPLRAFALGGNDPIEGIDVIVKRDPADDPVSEFSFSDDQIARLNRKQGEERVDYMAGEIAMVIAAQNKELPVDVAYEELRAQMLKTWCGECQDGGEYMLKAGEATLKITVKPSF